MRWQNWLLVAALADWLIGRTLSRAAIFMPKTGTMVSVAQAMTLTGQVAFNLASILTLAAVAWLTLRGFSRTERRLALSTALAGLIGLSLAGVIVAPGPAALLLFHALTLTALAALTVNGVRAQVRFSRSGIASGGGSHAADSRAWEPALLPKLDLLRFRDRLAIVLPALAIGSMTLFKIDHALGLMAGRSGPPLFALAAYSIGEFFVVLTPLAAWWAYGRAHRARDCLVAAIPAALFAMAYNANPSMTATLATWSLGLSLYLPWPVYAISLWLAALTTVRAIRAGHSIGYGLAFLTAAGYTAQLSSQVLLGLLGVWMLGLESLPDSSLKAYNFQSNFAGSNAW